MRTFAYECYADECVVVFLRDRCGLGLQGRHSYSQGEVINDLLVRGLAVIGMVDEDPESSHHGLRDKMEVVCSTDDLELRRMRDRHLIIVKPELEECFIRSMKRVGLPSNLPGNAKDLRRILNTGSHAKHQIFRGELGALHDESNAKKVSTFVTQLQSVVGKVI